MRRRRWGSSSQQTHTNCRDGGPVDSCGSEGEVVGSGVVKGDPMFQVSIRCVSNVYQCVSNVYQCVSNMSRVYQCVALQSTTSELCLKITIALLDFRQAMALAM